MRKAHTILLHGLVIIMYDARVLPLIEYRKGRVIIIWPGARAL